MTTEKQESVLLRVIIFREGDAYVAQCLEKDICVQGKNLEELSKRLSGTIGLERLYIENIPRAPNKFFEMWERGMAMSHEEFLTKELPETQIETRKLAA